MPRIFCKKHKCMVIVWKEHNTTKYEAYGKNSKCDCFFTEKEMEKSKVKIKYFLQNGDELINKGKATEWIIKKHAQ